MKKIFKSLKFTSTSLALVIVSQLLLSCVPTSSSVRGRSSSGSTGNANVGLSQGRILRDNPAILSGNPSLAITTDLSKYLSTEFITANPFLQSNPSCAGLTYCFQVQETSESASALQSADGKWAYKVTSEQFLQVNAFYHTNKLFTTFLDNLFFSLSSINYNGAVTPVYDTAIPNGIYNNGDMTYDLHKEPLKVFTNCDEENNAYFSPASQSICYGYSGAKKQIRWAQDSTVVYHETGHFIQNLQLNIRNFGLTVKSQLGQSFYSEASAIGEGLADFFSYYINGRAHWGEWAAGKVDSSRPMSEADDQHAPGISLEDDQRLSYPQYLTYDSNFATTPIEDVHTAGMIMSHYLVALTTELETMCSMTNKVARENVMYVLNESLAELGDLTSTGTELSGGVGKVNMDATNALTWFNVNNPINYRTLSQTIAKNMLLIFSDPVTSRCNGTTYPKDRIESVLDNYGLLLFKKYNQHRNLTSALKVNTSVTASNRKKTVLISKGNLILDPTTRASSAFVIDNREQILDGISKYVEPGTLTGTDGSLSYNNNNSKVSPGEVVAIAINLYNNSNSTMGGVEILANDWDHAETRAGTNFGKPCKFGASLSSDGWPLASEGAASVATDATSTCDTVATTAADFAPICFVQSSEAGSTKWISQKAYKEKIGLDDNSCLSKTSTKDCFIRAVKGFDKAYYSKINPKSTWGQTMANPVTGKAYGLGFGNVILFEVSKNVPPGTVVSCRMRARFTNCDDCYHDSTRDNNDFLDKEYNGPRPFKIIQLQIPITD